MNFEILNEISNIEIIASGRSIREFQRLCKAHGKGRWRKLKGFAKLKLASGKKCFAEIHWYEAHGIGKKEFKIKRIFNSAL